MDRTRRLASFWNWLPAFRAVAETEHLPTAARHLHVSPSALSRSVKQLEDAIGVPLFVRRGRRLQLLPAGRHLLDGVREAMRGFDDHLGVLDGTVQAPVRLRVAAPAPWVAWLILPVVESATVTVEHVEHAHREAAAMLIRGELDLLLASAPPTDDRLLVTRLADLQLVIAGRPERLAEPSFAAWAGDGWPPDLPRRTGLVTSQLELVLAACAAGTQLAVLPAALADHRGLPTRRHPRLGTIPLYLVRRRPLHPGWLDELAARIAARAAAVTTTSRRRSAAGGGRAPATRAGSRARRGPRSRSASSRS